MANPNSYEQRNAEQDVVTLHCAFTVGASGGVGTILRGREFDPTTPVTKETAAGTYTFNLREKWIGLSGLFGHVVQPSFDKTHGCYVNLKTDAVNSAGTFTIECRTADGNATVANPASGDTVSVTVHLRKTKWPIT